MHASSNTEITPQKSIALVGAPNSGKTTLYNWLTGSKFKTVNYPGSTVEYSMGSTQESLGKSALVIDTPGVYSLHPKSDDEVVTLKAIYENPEVGQVDAIAVIVDGTQMSRHLMMVEQIKETGFPFIIVITMSDLLRKQNIQLDKEVLEKTFQAPVILFDGLLGGGLRELVSEIEKISTHSQVKKPVSWDLITQEQKLKKCEELAQKSLAKNKSLDQKLQSLMKNTQKWDRFLLHPFWGVLSFVLIMTTIFSSIFWLAAPLMDGVDGGFTFLSDMISKSMSEGLLKDFLVNGVIVSFSSVLIFVPQIFILFFGISILEASGYLARAATLIDKPFSKLGLSGRSFVPLLSGFACAVPAMIASRNISSSRDRWITNFVIPLMTCSARLPVFALLLAFILADKPAWVGGLIMTAIYILSALIGAVASAILNKILPKNSSGFFMMELPLFRRPRWRVLLHQTISRTKAYIWRAGPVIFIFSVLMWAGTTFPRHENLGERQALQNSYLGQVGHFLEPVVEPMGVDWRVGVGLLSAFVAREVFVSSLAVMFNITDEDEVAQQQGLLVAMQEATFGGQPDGKKVFTLGSVLGLIVFFMIALQCMSTVAISLKESASWKFALSQLVVFNLVAYILAVAIYQGLRFF